MAPLSPVAFILTNSHHTRHLFTSTIGSKRRWWPCGDDEIYAGMDMGENLMGSGGAAICMMENLVDIVVLFREKKRGREGIPCNERYTCVSGRLSINLSFIN